MLIRTHLLITLFFIIAFFESVEHKFVFLVVAILATYLPDIDSKFSKIGNRKILRIFQWFVKHRGMIHSFSFLLLITMFFVLFFPILAFGFFLGYGLHLLADSFTITGITPFYPHKKKISGKVRTGGKSETAVLVLFVMADLVLFFWKMFG